MNGAIELTQLENGDLKIVLNPKFVEELKDHVNWDEGKYTYHHMCEILREFSSDFECDYDEILPEEVGDLTDQPTIGYNVDRNDQGELVDFEKRWYLPNYSTQDELKELITTGEVIYTLVK